MGADRPPGPDGLPLLGNTLAHVREQGDLYERVAREYGSVARLRVLGVGTFYQVADPGLVESMLVTDRDRFRKHDLARRLLGDLLGDGLVLNEGETWRRHRRLVEPAFEAARMETYANVMADHAAQTAERWQAGETYDVLSEMQRLTLRIIVESMFGTEIDYDRWAIGDTVEALQEPGRPRKQPIAFAVPKWVPLPMWRRYGRAVERFDDLVAETISRRREREGRRDDLLGTLLAARDGDGGLTDREVRDELVTMLFAGHETTAIALTFAWYLLARHPEVDRRLARELRTVLGDDRPGPGDVPDLEYTRWVVREAMRLYPPVPATPRETTTDVDLGGYRVPEGSLVLASQWAVHRDPAHYEDPLSFRPERWANPDWHDFAYFPFGRGPRQCIGRRFALTEATLVLATLARAFEVDLVSAPSLDLSVSVTTRPTSPVEVRVAARTPPE
ncbi:MAG: cytochrome P450 [Haloarculaceae archaeon]